MIWGPYFNGFLKNKELFSIILTVKIRHSISLQEMA